MYSNDRLLISSVFVALIFALVVMCLSFSTITRNNEGYEPEAIEFDVLAMIDYNYEECEAIDT